MALRQGLSSRVVVLPGRDRSVRRRHPWVFSGAIDRVEGGPEPGDLVLMETAQGEVLGTAFFNPKSDIRARVWELCGSPAPSLLPGLTDRVEAALRLRKQVLDLDKTTAYRLLNSEGDDVSGLIVDVYGENVVIQVLACWVDKHLEAIKELLVKLLGARNVWLRVPRDNAAREGIAASEGPYPAHAEPSESGAWVTCSSARLWVDLRQGQKTGLFLDQAANWPTVSAHARGVEVLDLFCNNGGFSLHAALAGATKVVAVDRSQAALEALRSAVKVNELPEDVVETCQADVKSYLAQPAARGPFGLVILDPPPFARRPKDVDKASRAYKELNRRAMLAIQEGMLATFSCSPYVNADLFRKIVFAASVDAGRRVRVLSVLGAGADHPVSIFHPEGAYLDGLLLHVSR